MTTSDILIPDKKIQEAAARWQKIAAQVQSSNKISELIKPLTEALTDLFDCEVVTLFRLDRAKRQLYAENTAADNVPEIRFNISRDNLVGYVAALGKPLNIADAYNAEELSKHHPQLSFDSSWDQKLNFRTRSLLVIPLPHNKKMVGIMEIINKKNGEQFTTDDLNRAKMISPVLGLALIKLDLEKLPMEGPAKQTYERAEKSHAITQAIHAAKNVDSILIELKKSILELFDAEAITIYVLDSEKNEIYSKVKTGEAIEEIRVPISPKSVAGFAAWKQKILNINDVYNEDELKKYHASLSFDSSWDKKTGFKSRSMLVYPLIHQKKLMGVLQLINKKSGAWFNALDEEDGLLMAETLALAFYNQTKFVPPKPTKFSLLLNKGLITEEELTDATAKARVENLDTETVLVRNFNVKREEVGKSLEHFYNVPYYGYNSSIVLDPRVFTGLNKNYLLKNLWVPIQNDKTKAVILVDDPSSESNIQNIKLIFRRKKVEFKVGLKLDILDFLKTTEDGEEAIEEAIEEGETEEISSLLSALRAEKEEDGNIQTVMDEEEESAISDSDSGIVRLVNKILTDAYDQGVSDIHIEPGIGKENMTIRYRKDGACRVYEEIPAMYRQAFLSRLKIMSKLDIAEKRLPQDGKIKMKYGKNEVEFRVATCPTVGNNEDAVLRILAASKPIPLDKMNFSERNLTLLKEKISKPYGLVLVVGPTGSGKTTTLHSALGHINVPDRKIWTAEDPVEITQKGLRQVQMQDKIGLNFARAMRSFLRCDPDVIMVGEMRDAETCAIGLEASLTGHLVFSTLHTNSAPETITRLLDMGMNPLNFADALLLILAQRLVRTLCKNCKKAYHPSREEFDILVGEYGKDEFPALGIEYTDDLTLNKAVGCEKCMNTGYAGRTGLHELLEGTNVMKNMIMKKDLIDDLREQAIRDGMTTLKQDGIWKIFKGQCDLKQVQAVCIV
ncbi:MAG: ATPase, T2SS/T4P/T4SS family [Nitrospinales bacterium]